MASQRARLTGRAALTLGGLTGSFECVHMCAGREKVVQAGKMREENGNKLLLVLTLCLIHLCYPRNSFNYSVMSMISIPSL